MAPDNCHRYLCKIGVIIIAHGSAYPQSARPPTYILTECSDDEKSDISSSLKDFADNSSWVEDYNLLEMVALGGKPAGVVKLEEQYAEGLSGSEAA